MRLYLGFFLPFEDEILILTTSFFEGLDPIIQRIIGTSNDQRFASKMEEQRSRNHVDLIEQNVDISITTITADIADATYPIIQREIQQNGGA